MLWEAIVDVCQLLKTKSNQGNDTPTRINLTTDANELQVGQLGEDARTLAATTLETFDCSVDPDRVCNYSHNGHDVSALFLRQICTAQLLVPSRKLHRRSYNPTLPLLRLLAPTPASGASQVHPRSFTRESNAASLLTLVI